MNKPSVTTLLTYDEAAEACKMSVWWIREQVRKGRLSVVRFGRHPRIRPEALELFVTNSDSASISLGQGAKIQLVENKVGVGR